MAAPVFVADEVVTAAKMNSLPKGVLGYAEVTANQASITTETDLTGLSVTVDVAASRRIKITALVRPRSTVAGDFARARIKESTTVLKLYDVDLDKSTSGYPAQFSHIETPSSGSHTYKLSLQRVLGSGSLTLEAAATFESFILVEDIGGV